MAGVTVKRTLCALCGKGCGVEVHVVDGKVRRVAGDRSSPTGGKLCPKAAGAIDLHTHPDRLNYPLRRVGRRGEGKWQQVTWSEATDEISGKLASIRDRYGPEALAYLGGTLHAPGDWLGWRFCNLFGTPNIFGQGKNCGEAEFLAECAVYGCDTISSSPVPGLTRCLVIWGANPAESSHLVFRSLPALKKAGAKLVVIDPRYTETAAMADLWLPLRPATDGALALGMLNVIVAEGLFDRAFVDEWCLSFARIEECVQEYTPEKVAGITGLPAEQIVETARLYATNRPGIISFGVATCHLGSGAGKSAVLGKTLLRAITGNLDVPGGQTLRQGLADVGWPQNLHWNELVRHPLRTRDNVSAEQFPIATVKSYALYRQAMKNVYPEGYPASQYMLWISTSLAWQAILEQKPYPLRAAITLGGNPLLTVSGSRDAYKALVDDKLELHVGMDLFMTPTLQLADYVLPAADFTEHAAALCGWGLSDQWAIGQKAVEPLFERREDYQFWRDLGRRLGQAEYWPDTYEELLDVFLAQKGQTFGELAAKQDIYHRPPIRYEKYKERGFATFSGKAELAPTLFERLGYDPLPKYEEPPQSPIATRKLVEEYPFILISGSRLRWYTHSTMRQIPRLRNKHPEPILQIHPDAAAKLGIEPGDWVYIETSTGRIQQKAELTTAVAPEVVHAEAYWWFPEKPAQAPTLFGLWDSNVNAIIPDSPEVCDYAGDQFFRGPLCRVYKGDGIGNYSSVGRRAADKSHGFVAAKLRLG